jgi:hypothetical protein
MNDNMKQLVIPRIDNIGEIAEISTILDTLEKNPIDCVNWQEFPYKPEVVYAMAYDANHLFLKYYVTEKHACAVASTTNGRVWEDSCCEFFCSFNDDGKYYNLEINCIGVKLLGWHPDSKTSIHLPESQIQAIKAVSSLGDKPLSVKGDIDWNLTLIIPATVFTEHPNLKFNKEMQFRANFFKCGDKTETPHFLTWNAVKTSKPSFHQSDSFGTIVLGN